MIDDDWAEVEDLDVTSTAASKGLQSPVVVVEEEVSDVLSSLSIAGASGVTRMTSDTGFKDSVNHLTETLKSFKSSFDDTLKELLRLNMKMDKERFQKNIVGAEERIQKTLERALILTDLDSFEYYVVDNNQVFLSSSLANGVIGRFMLGQGSILPHAILTNLEYNIWTEKTIMEKDTMVKEFVDKFVNQMKTLIKKEPLIVKVGDLSYEVYY